MIIGTNSSFFVTQNNSFINSYNVIEQLNKKNKLIHLPNYTYNFFYFALRFKSSSEYDFIKKISENINVLSDSLNLINAEISYAKFLELEENVDFYNKQSELQECNDNINKIKNIYEMNIFNKNVYKSIIMPSLSSLTISSDLFLNNINCDIFVKLLDLFLAVPMYFIDDDHDQVIRKKFFQAGDYSKYGSEISYYFLSNFWLKLQNSNVAKLIYEIISFCYSCLESGDYHKFYDTSKDYVNVFGYNYFELAVALNKSDFVKIKKYLAFIYNFLPDHIIAEIENNRY